MRVEIEDFKTGWYGIAIGMDNDQIEKMIGALKRLQKTKEHFHFRSDFKGERGVADIEFYLMKNGSKSNMEID